MGRKKLTVVGCGSQFVNNIQTFFAGSAEKLDLVLYSIGDAEIDEIKEVAEILRESDISAIVSGGLLPRTRIGKYWYSPKSIEEFTFLESQGLSSGDIALFRIAKELGFQVSDITRMTLNDIARFFNTNGTQFFKELFLFSQSDRILALSQQYHPLERVDPMKMARKRLNEQRKRAGETTLQALDRDHKEFVESLESSLVDYKQKAINLYIQLGCVTGLFPRIPGLYILLAPPGFGKTTILTKARYHGLLPISKITTRPYRSKYEAILRETISVSRGEFQLLQENDALCLSYSTNGHNYGYRRGQIEGIVLNGDTRILTTTNPDLALKLKDQLQERAKLAIITRAPSEVDLGLENRLHEAFNDGIEIFSESDKQDYLRNMSTIVHDTKDRLRKIQEIYTRVMNVQREADIVLDSPSIEENAERLLQEIYTAKLE